VRQSLESYGIDRRGGEKNEGDAGAMSEDFGERDDFPQVARHFPGAAKARYAAIHNDGAGRQEHSHGGQEE
jgi:hypothetical protein